MKPPTKIPREAELSLSLKASKLGEITVVTCRGRIVWRERAAALSEVVAGVLEHSKHVILHLDGVSAIDSTGIGELVSLHLWAQGCGGTLKLSGLSSRLIYLLELTNLSTVFEIFPTPEAALHACHAA
ncbi:MAG: STAS domain-containing protein [Acidobacteria bacterium]|nr:STAS domain-containing protein [Acidobacteriota bacterium]MBV8894772.1 STAS domain-containing protein [Acidobacteriota bacterium]MBV9480150.1 STAS domain-containing protein [Acidobacteriota bacterium]